MGELRAEMAAAAEAAERRRLRKANMLAVADVLKVPFPSHARMLLKCSTGEGLLQGLSLLLPVPRLDCRGMHRAAAVLRFAG